LNIAGAWQIFHKNFFFCSFLRKPSPRSEKKNFILKNLPGDCNTSRIYEENFPGSEKKNFILKNLPGDCNTSRKIFCYN
jgi:hypothetical protein